jgi:hypothetical protein
VQVSRMQLTHSLKAPGFEPSPLNIQSWFQIVPINFNVRRYAEGYGVCGVDPGWGAERWNQVDP